MRVVYVTHNGIGTALVRSQVLPYLDLLRRRGYDVDLITFERGDPYPEGEFPRDRWHPLTPNPGGSLSAKVKDIARGIWVVLRVAARVRPDTLHARSYLPAAICWVVSRVLRIPFVFDMRGFMGEEYVDAGSWSRTDLRYRALTWAEGLLLRSAAHVVVLTNAAADQLRSDRRYRGRVSRITVIPCAVDLERFRPSPRSSSVPTLVYSGSLGTWYLLDEMVRAYAHALAHVPALRFLFLNRTDHQLIEQSWARHGLPRDLLEIRACRFEEVPAQLGRAHVGIAFLRMTPSKLASSPIKVAEYLACGLPVVLNDGIGDAAQLIRQAGAGHIVSSYEPRMLARAGAAIATLVTNDGAPRAARRLAEDVFDVKGGAIAYDRVYAAIASAGAS